MLKKHEINKSDVCPAPKIEDAGDEEDYQMSDLRLAQALTGELSWVASRSRPDLTLAVGLISRLTRKAKNSVKDRLSDNEIPLRIKRLGSGISENWGEGTEEPEDLCRCVIWFGAWRIPVSTRNFCNALGEMPAWASTRQPFIAQSTAEAELLAYNESLQTAEALIALLKVFEREVIGGLLGDSKSAMSHLALRTRHLRLRSAKLREVLQYPKKWWVQHVPGSTLDADGLTKPLQGQ